MRFLKYIIFFFFSSCHGQALFHAHNQASAPPCDVDAAAFNTAAGITDPVEQAAVCQLATSLKAASLWTKFYAIYPMVGGTATTCKFNLKDPRDLDAAFRITFPVSTFSSTGVFFSSPGDTKFIETVSAVTGSLSFSYYSRTNVTAAEYEMGRSGSGGLQALIIKYSDGNHYGSIDGGSQTASAVSDTRGFFTLSRIATNSMSFYRNGVSLTTQTGNSASNPCSGTTYIGGAYGLVGSTKECAFASIGKGLTAAEVSALYTIIQTFETALSRQM